MGDKKTTTQATTSTTPNVPQWGVDSLQTLNGSIGSIAATDPSKFVTPASALQTQAQKGAAGLGVQSGQDAGAAGGILTGLGGSTTGQIGGIPTVSAPIIKASSLLDGLQSYMSPYTKDVVNTSLDDYDQNAAKARAAEEAAGAAAGAFGGSRFGVQQATTLDNQARARATLDAGLRDSAFTTGSSLSNEDATRRQGADTSNAGNSLSASTSNAANALDMAKANQAAQEADYARQLQAALGLTSLSGTENANDISNISTQDHLGGEQRGIAQDQATAPISQAQVIAALLQQNQLGLLTGSTGTSNGTQTTSDPMGAISSLMSAAGSAAQGAAMFSDGRLKRDVETLGYSKGRRVVSWAYIWDRLGAVRHTGHIAQELLQTDPQAVRVGPGGFLMVDYGAL
jgi:hypothetical protein